MSTEQSGRFLASGRTARIIGRIAVCTGLLASPSPPPALADDKPDAARGSTERFEAGGFVYHVRTPSGYEPDSGRRYPLLVVLHWAYVSGPSFLHHWQADADRHGLIVAAPTSRGDASWLESDGVHIRRMVTELSQRYDVDPGRIWLAGYSAGGEFAYHLLFTYPDLFSAVLPIGGHIDHRRLDLPSEEAPRSAHVCIFHGERDHRHGEGSDSRDRETLADLGFEIQHTTLLGLGPWLPRGHGDAMVRCLNRTLPVRPALGRRPAAAHRHSRRSPDVLPDQAGRATRCSEFPRRA